MLKYFLSAAAAVLSGAVGCVYTFKRLGEEKEVPKKEKNVVIILTAVIFAAVSMLFPMLIPESEMRITAVFRIMILLYALFFIAVIDHKTMTIPNKILLAMLCAVIVTFIAEAFMGNVYNSVINSLLGSAVCFVIFFIGKLISKNGMGMGDIKLAAVIGLYLGIDRALGAILWSLIAAAAVGVILMVSKKAKAKSKISMGPFFFAGTLISHVIYIVSNIAGGIWVL